MRDAVILFGKPFRIAMKFNFNFVFIIIKTHIAEGRNRESFRWNLKKEKMKVNEVFNI